MSVKFLQRSFGGGEVTPEFFGRIDDVKYQTGLAKCRNFIVKPHGPVENRPGLEFVREVKDSSKKTRLIPFTFSTTQTMVVEMGAGYFRFHTQGATLMTAGEPYEISSPYKEEDLFDIKYVQSGDIVTLTHPDYQPRELRRLGAANWSLEAISFMPPAKPSKPSLSRNGGSEEKYDYSYVVTALSEDLTSESEASSSATIKANLYETGQSIEISWSGVSGAARYNVYKMQGGIFGYIGQTTGTSIVDDDIDPDLSKTPPIFDNAFDVKGQITSVEVTNGGSGYGSNIGGEITSIPVANEGLYSSPFVDAQPTFSVQISDPTGSGAQASVEIGEMMPVPGRFFKAYMVKSIKIISGGKGYTNPTAKITLTNSSDIQTNKKASLGKPRHKALRRVTLKVTDGSGKGSGAEVEPVITNGALAAVNVVKPGYNYVNPSISFSDSAGGSGAVIGSINLATQGDYPGAVSYYEQRKCFAGSRSKPHQLWMTRSGTETDLTYSLPLLADDRINFRVAAREANTILHIVPLTSLLLFTSSAEWVVNSVDSDALTPTSISVKPVSYIGSSSVQPIVANNSVVYCAARGGHIREIGHNWQAGGFVSGDLSLRAPHLFDNLTVMDMAYAKAPIPIVWCVSSNGKLLGLTYVPEQKVGAWHWHDTDGEFESIAVVSEGDEDVLYAVVRREIDGQKKRYIERMCCRNFVSPEDAFFVDSGGTYRGEPTSIIGGLDWLEGKTVSILADGAVHPQREVVDGTIILDHEASVVHVGLPIYADLETLPVALNLQDGSFGQARYKNVNKAWLRVYRSGGIFVGPDEDSLVEAKQRTDEPYGTPPALKTEEIEIMLRPGWSDSGQIYVRQYDPLPLTVVNMTLEIALG